MNRAIRPLAALLAIMTAGMATDARALMGWESLARPKTMNVAVWVEGIEIDSAELGLIRNCARTMVESRLRGAGIEVPADSDAYLDVNIRVGTRNHSYWAEVFLKLMQPELPEDSASASYVSTWEKQTLGMASTSDLPGLVKAVLDQGMDGFIKNWPATISGD